MANNLSRRGFDMFDPMDFFNQVGNFGRDMFGNMAGNPMKTDVVENKDNYTVTADLPGFKKDGIHIDYRDDTLRINATHELSREDKDDEGNVLRQERSTANIARAFYLPNVDKDNVKATYDGGVLTLQLPKINSNPDTDHRIEIQ